MATLPTIKQVTREDLREAPDWIERLLNPLNQFMASVYQALNGALTFGTNIRGSVRELRFNTSATYDTGDFTPLEFPTGLGGVKAIGCLILQLNESASAETVLTGASVANWTERNGRIAVKYISGLANSTKYTVRFLVI